MNKGSLLKDLRNASRGNHFSIKIAQATKEDENKIEELAKELVREGKIKLKEFTQQEHSVYLKGILKYASE
ncbi:hypothetical protein [Ectobacillus panaciterrae]|uniref:hypothetical protein n=1 Tax=Ectobacillus panaciterrae TaxID=363872 RepID=UPI0003F96CBB|nr:hypothetical protein [Ectobacillus panaciterrae]